MKMNKRLKTKKARDIFKKQKRDLTIIRIMLREIKDISSIKSNTAMKKSNFIKVKSLGISNVILNFF